MQVLPQQQQQQQQEYAEKSKAAADLRRQVVSLRQEVAQLESTLQRRSAHEVRISLSNLATYVLPLLMGFLGALTYLLQSMTTQLRDHTYVPVAASGTIVRLCLGGIAGVFGGLLGSSGDPALKSLPPLFVPFVFGYGIEILFALLNKIVRTFTQSNGTPTPP